MNEDKRIRTNDTLSQGYKAANSVYCTAASLCSGNLTSMFRFDVVVPVQIGSSNSCIPTALELLDLKRTGKPPSDETISFDLLRRGVVPFKMKI